MIAQIYKVLLIGALCVAGSVSMAQTTHAADSTVCDSGCDYALITGAVAAVTTGTKNTITVRTPYTANERVSLSKSGAGVGSELEVKANMGDTITVQGFYISGSYIIVDGFDVTGYAVRYQGLINIVPMPTM